MKHRTFVTFGLVAALTGGAGFVGGRALGAAEKKTHVEADSAEIDRTAGYLNATVNNAAARIKEIAGETTAENAEAKKQEREAALEATLKPLQEDGYTMVLQGHLLAVDSIADKTGAPAEQFIQENIYKKIGVEPQEVSKRREATGLGHGGIILGYLIAKVSKLPADTIFTSKEGKSWPEVMRARGVSVGQVVMVLEGKE